MARGRRRKCTCCRRLFRPDPSNRRHHPARRWLPRLMALSGARVGELAQQRWSRNFAQGVKWNSCLTAGTIEPANQERP